MVVTLVELPARARSLNGQFIPPTGFLESIVRFYKGPVLLSSDQVFGDVKRFDAECPRFFFKSDFSAGHLAPVDFRQPVRAQSYAGARIAQQRQAHPLYIHAAWM